MTVQMKDGFFSEGERFLLPAVPDGKPLPCKDCVGEAPGAIRAGRYRGSLAEYEADGRILLPKEDAAHVFDGVASIAASEFYAKRKPPRCHPGIEIPFAGQLVICHGARSRTSRVGLPSEALRPPS